MITETPDPDPAALRAFDIIRLHEGPKIFGYAPTVLAEKIRSGQIPEPLFLSDDGRARGWTGAQVLKWVADNEAAQAARKATAEARTAERTAQILAGKAAAKKARQAERKPEKSTKPRAKG